MKILVFMMHRSIPVYLLELFILCITITSILTCQPPDGSEGGSYKPEQPIYLPGDKVVYSCRDRTTRFGKDTRVCQTTGKWSGSTPFCDGPSRMKNPSASSDPKGRVTNVVDGRPDTCFQTKNSSEQKLTIYLDPPAAVYMIRIYLQQGNARLAIDVCQRKGRTSGPFCTVEDVRNMVKDQWVILECKDNDIQADYIEVKDISGRANILAICEIEVFVKDDAWCKHPPDIFIPNGRLEVSRSKASLRCGEKYRESLNTRLVCEKNAWTGPILQCEEILCNDLVGNVSHSGGEWRRLTSNTGKYSVDTQRKLSCNPGYRMSGEPDVVTCLKHGSWSSTTAACIAKEPDKKPNFKIIAIAVGSVIFMLIFFLLGLALFLIQKKRHREVVVIYKPSEDPYTLPSLNSVSTAVSCDAEYASVYYEAIRHNGPPPMPTRPSPYLGKGYTKPVDDLSQQEVVLSSSNPLPTDIAFGTLKSSSIYDAMQ